ncbi:hypothetical protein [Paenibacillus terrigena]|uniref:hypothetical protein n=1 Tax=Paenibacillus terrigena TaxID=369333 RepID=UPI00037F15BF|nr:hypothetical protein [Paenibacillus terrigena]
MKQRAISSWIAVICITFMLSTLFPGILRASASSGSSPVTVAPEQSVTVPMEIPDHPQLNALRNLQWLQTDARDITGDREQEQIGLLGGKDDPNSDHYQLVYLIYKDVKHQKTSVTFIQGGYRPSMVVCDLNGDQVNDVLVKLPKGSNTEKANYRLYTVKNQEVVPMPAPNPIEIVGQLENDYTITLKAKGQDTYAVNMKDRKEKYDAAGYYKNGKLLRPTKVSNASFEVIQPVDFDKNGTTDLQGVQKVTGASDDDVIAYVHSLWTWEDGKWRQLHVYVQKAVK